MHHGVVSRMLTTQVFRFMLLKRAYTKPEMESMLTGFKTVQVLPDDIGMHAWFEK
jgi:hypothetical protein